MTRQALGKGLEALLPQAHHSALVELDLEEIQPNPLQPRLYFESQKLEELAASIQENGILQPIVVRQCSPGYQIVAGERRWRAAQKAGLHRVPAIVQDVSDETMLAITLVENIQRDDLSPIEEGHAYQLLMEGFHLTQEEISRRVGRSRTSITNTLRLLRLPKVIQGLVVNRQISMGHARALLPLPRKEQERLAQRVVKEELSVRQVERYVQRQQGQKPPGRWKPAKDANLEAAERTLEELWKTKVEIRQRADKGQIIIHFHSAEERDHLYRMLLAESVGSPHS